MKKSFRWTLAIVAAIAVVMVMIVAGFMIRGRSKRAETVHATVSEQTTLAQEAMGNVQQESTMYPTIPANTETETQNSVSTQKNTSEAVTETDHRNVEQEASKRAVEEEASRLAAEVEEASKRAAEEEASRQAAEAEEASKRAAEEEASRLAAEAEEASKRAAEEEASRLAAEAEEASKRAAEEEASRQAAEAEGKLKTPFSISYLGDSITVGYLSDYSYADLVTEHFNARGYNYGIAGNLLSTDDANGMVDRYGKIFQGSDVIVVYGGNNDFYEDVTLGSESSSKTDEFYGALKVLCEGLKNKYPKAHIVFITPMKGQFYGVHTTGENEAGASMYDYVDAIKTVCAKYSIDVLDIFNNFVIDVNNYDDYTVDGLHPNEDGHKEIAKILEQYIQSLM